MRHATNIDRYQNRVEWSREVNSTKKCDSITTREIGGRILLKFAYDEECVKLIKSIPGAKWVWESFEWSVSTRFNKRIAEVLPKIEATIAENKRLRDIEDATNQAREAAALKVIDDDAAANPLTVPPGWRAFSEGGRWHIVSPYDRPTVFKFKSIPGARWTGSAWTFPAGARSSLEALIADVMT